MIDGEAEAVVAGGSGFSQEDSDGLLEATWAKLAHVTLVLLE